jgi:acyl-CoA synthetase (AMP-forming)/AMP-acid ligase II
VAGGVPGSNMGGHFVLTGRAKDTIVLSNGENIEPQPVEDLIQCSPFIKYAMLIGQDRRQLGALIVEDVDAFADLATSQGVFSPLQTVNEPLDALDQRLFPVAVISPWACCVPARVVSQHAVPFLKSCTSGLTGLGQKGGIHPGDIYVS